MKNRYPKVLKNYPREYERVFTGDDLVKRKCDIAHVETAGDAALNSTAYVRLFQDTLRSFERQIFDHLVKHIWLVRKFKYRGHHRKYLRNNGIFLDKAFGVFMRHYVGYDNRLYLCSNGPFGKIVDYFDDFFPNFDLGNPFSEAYEFPFEHVTLSHLVVVYQMDERLELLRLAESKRMSYTEFLDYVVNYISCYNDEHGKKYEFIFSHVFIPYIKNFKRKP